MATQIAAVSELRSNNQFTSALNDFKEKFNLQLMNYYNQQSGKLKKPWTQARVIEVISFIKSSREAMDSGTRRTPMQYYWNSKYDLIQVGDEDYLILKKKSPKDPTIHVIPLEKYYDLLLEIHKDTGHGGRDKILNSVKSRFYVPKKAIEIFLTLCPTCETKRNLPKRSIEPESSILKGFNTRARFDLIDLQSLRDKPFNWLLVYQDLDTKFIQLRPLQNKQSFEVASELVKIFLIFSAPLVLQSESEKVFVTQVIEDVVKIWPELKIEHGYQRDQIYAEFNKGIETALHNWMNDNCSTQWSIGCHFVQYQKNTSFLNFIGKTPHRAVFGCDPKSGGSSENSTENMQTCLKTKDVEEQSSHRNNIDVVTNSQIQHSESFDYSSKNSAIIDKDIVSLAAAKNLFTATSDSHNNIDNIQKPIDIYENVSSNIKMELVEINIEGSEHCRNTYDSSNETMQNHNTCSVCGEFIFSGLQCSSCFSPVHAACAVPEDTNSNGEKILCFSCQNQFQTPIEEVEHASHSVRTMGLHAINDNESSSENTEFRKMFHQQLIHFYDQQLGAAKKPWTNARVLEVISHIKKSKEAMDHGVRRTSMQYYWSNKYDLVHVGDEEYLTLKKKTPNDPTIRLVPLEKYFDLLMEVHKETGHGRRDKMLFAIRDRFYIAKKAIEIFVSLCPSCAKRTKRCVFNKVIEPKSAVAVFGSDSNSGQQCEDFFGNDLTCNETEEAEETLEYFDNTGESVANDNLTVIEHTVKTEVIDQGLTENELTPHGVKRTAEALDNDKSKKLLNFSVEDSIFLNIPITYRGPFNVKSISGKIVDFHNNLYRVGTKLGIIDNWFPQHELQYASNQYNYDVPETVITLEEAVTKITFIGDQVLHKCSCKSAKNQCQNNRCVCFKNKILCRSECHSRMTCFNK